MADGAANAVFAARASDEGDFAVEIVHEVLRMIKELNGRIATAACRSHILVVVESRSVGYVNCSNSANLDAFLSKVRTPSQFENFAECAINKSARSILFV